MQFQCGHLSVREGKPVGAGIRGASHDNGMTTDLICFGATVSVREKGSRWEQVLVLLDKMRNSGTTDVISLNVTISACKKRGQWE